MSERTLLTVYRTLQTGLSRTQSSLSAVLPAAGAAFNPLLSTLNSEVSALDISAVRSAFNFDGPETAELMRCYQLACDLHRIHPTQFPAPPVLARPPVVEDPVTVARLQTLYRLNGQRLPETLTYRVPGYCLTIHRAVVTQASVLDLYGEQVTVSGDGLPLCVSEADILVWLRTQYPDLVEHADHWKDPAAFEEHIVAVELLNQEAVDDASVPSSLVTQIRQHATNVRRARSGGVIPDDYVWNWVKIRYALQDQAPQLLDSWIPVGHEPVSEVVEPAVPHVHTPPEPVAPVIEPVVVHTPEVTPVHEAPPVEAPVVQEPVHEPMTLEAHAHHALEPVHPLDHVAGHADPSTPDPDDGPR